MKKLNKKGFTLIELLAVIVIMAILVAVAIPAVTRYLDTARKGTYYDNIAAAVSAVRNDVISNNFTGARGGVYYLGSSTAANPSTPACFSLNTDRNGNQILKAETTYKTKEACDNASTTDAPKYWSTGWINDLLEKKLVNSSYGAAYSPNSYIKVTYASGVYTYHVCVFDIEGNGFCGKEADLKNDEIKSGITYKAPDELN